jgi:hypothetical protein
MLIVMEYSYERLDLRGRAIFGNVENKFG